MSERIDQFCENLRIKLTTVDKGLQALKTTIDAKTRNAEQDVRTYLAAVEQRAERDRARVTAARHEMKKWLDERKAVSDEMIAKWKANLDRARLQSRAEQAEVYATAAALVASAAVDEAEQASLEAWLARKDADTGKGTKAA